MYRKEFVKRVAKRAKINQKATQAVILAMLDEMEIIVAHGEQVTIQDYGTFRFHHIKGGWRNNPQIGGGRVLKPSSGTIKYEPAARVKKKLATWVQTNGNPLEGKE